MINNIINLLMNLNICFIPEDPNIMPNDIEAGPSDLNLNMNYGKLITVY